MNDPRNPYRRSAEIDERYASYRRGASGRGAPALLLGTTVACLTALGLVLGALDGSAPAQNASAIGGDPAATISMTSADATVATPGVPTTPVPATQVPGAPVSAAPVPVTPVFVAGATIAPLADLVARVGGGRVEVVSVVPQGVDGHTYEPTPSDVAGITRTNVTFLPSISLNPSVTRAVEANQRPGAMMVDLLETTMSEGETIVDRVHSHGSGASHGHANVHTWTDPTVALRWVEQIRLRLSELDPGGAEVYAANAADLTARVSALHEATIAATATVPTGSRTLVVYHDSWSYFGRTYGFKVLGALQAADFAEPSAAEVARMVDQVRGAGVPAFFGAAVFPVEVLKRVSEEAGVPYVADLSDDSLPGKPGDPEHGYLGMMVQNVRHIVTSLGGDASRLDGLAL